MVHVGRYASHWGVVAALGVALGVLSYAQGDDASAQPAHAPGRHTKADRPDPSDPAVIHRDAQRVAAALEERNRYDESAEGQKDARDAAKAAQKAATWAFWLFVAGVAETAITAGGVLLVYFTLREAKRSADAAHDTLDHIRDATERELRAYLFVDQGNFIFPEPPDHPGKTAIKVLNTGQTPAYAVRLYIGWHFGPHEPHPPLTLNTDMEVSEFDLGPGQSMFKYDQVIDFNETQRADFWSGKWGMFLHGEVRYRDIFSKERVTYFRLMTGGQQPVQSYRTAANGPLMIALDAAFEGNHAT